MGAAMKYILLILYMVQSISFAAGEPVQITTTQDISKIKYINLQIINTGYENYFNSAIKLQKFKEIAHQKTVSLLSKRGIKISSKSPYKLIIENTFTLKQETIYTDEYKTSSTYSYENGKMINRTSQYTVPKATNYEALNTASYGRILYADKEIGMAETKISSRYEWDNEDTILNEELGNIISGFFGKLNSE